MKQCRFCPAKWNAITVGAYLDHIANQCIGLHRAKDVLLEVRLIGNFSFWQDSFGPVEYTPPHKITPGSQGQLDDPEEAKDRNREIKRGQARDRKPGYFTIPGPGS